MKFAVLDFKGMKVVTVDKDDPHYKDYKFVRYIEASTIDEARRRVSNGGC